MIDVSDNIDLVIQNLKKSLSEAKVFAREKRESTFPSYLEVNLYLSVLFSSCQKPLELSLNSLY